ncbi:unannotated protein [freshwater metagenome]|uniref:Unannotated protein n=1 Tax=freshwater metagenome TaxID=449393 RepID=A0A6J7FEU3_9ZZZZ|nr:hypothetical protein [Actinomycetota bacterium]
MTPDLSIPTLAGLTGLGPLQPLLQDPLVNEIMINNGGDVWVEREGAVAMAGRLDDDITPRIIERILNPLGRRLDRLSPIVDARLPDGTRVCAVIAPIAIDGTCLTLRRFGVRRRSMADFADASVAAVLHGIVSTRCNVLISGAASSGKTSLLNVMASRIGTGERVITLEDTAELQLDAAHVLRLETRPATSDGVPAITMSDLVRTSLRLRPDRLVVGEIRGREVIDMLQAMNTGHDGSMATCHANGPLDTLRRIEALLVQHAPNWPVEAVRDHVRSCIDVVVHLQRSAGGRRRVSDVLELALPGTPDLHRAVVADSAVVGNVTRGRH